jgi:hypothetical protein
MTKSVDAHMLTASVIGEILAGDALTLAAGARTLPPHRGQSVAPSTLRRWGRRGVRTPDGRRVYLELARVGGPAEGLAAGEVEPAGRG